MRPVLLSLCLLAGCAPAKLATLRVSALPEGEQTWRDVALDATLKSGDRLGLQVGVSHPMYVYVLSGPGRGPLKTLFPTAGARLITPGAALSLPEGAGFLEVEPQAGATILWAVASVRPLGTAQVAQEVAAFDRRDPPPMPKEKHVRGPAPGAVLRGPVNARGIAVLRFKLRSP
jgi:hypothetical protein